MPDHHKEKQHKKNRPGLAGRLGHVPCTRPTTSSEKPGASTASKACTVDRRLDLIFAQAMQLKPFVKVNPKAFSSGHTFPQFIRRVPIPFGTNPATIPVGRAIRVIPVRN
jgi:hypothetical protein